MVLLNLYLLRIFHYYERKKDKKLQPKKYLFYSSLINNFLINMEF